MKTVSLLWVLPLLFLTPSTRLGAREDRFTTLSIRDGLSQSIVWSMKQDGDGFLWLGTENGLNRYDGYSFRTYRPELRNPHSLSHSNILCLEIEAEDTLWVGTFHGGLNRMNTRTGRSERFRHQNGQPLSLPSDVVRCLLRDHQGTLWVGTDAGLCHLNRRHGTFTPVQLAASDASPAGTQPSILSLTQDLSGTLWAGTARDGLFWCPGSSGIWKPFPLPRPTPDPIQDLLEDHLGHLWVATRGSGLLRVNHSRTRVDRVSADENHQTLSSNTVWRLCEDPQERLWIGTDRGLDRLDPSTGTWSHFIHRADRSTSLGHSIVRAMLVDRSGLLWLGTYGGGVSVCNRGRKDFEVLGSDSPPPGTLGSNIIFSIFEDRQRRIWVGTHGGGLHCLDQQGRVLTRYHQGGHPDLGTDMVRTVCQDRENALWIGTDGNGLCVLDPEQNTMVHFRNRPGDPESLCHDEIRCLYVDSRQRLWIGTHGGGLDLWQPDTRTFRHMALSSDPSSSSEMVVRALCEDTAGRFWVATYGHGLFYLNPQARRFLQIPTAGTNRPGLPSPFLFDLLPAPDGALWVASDGGVTRIDPDLKRYTHHTTREGLPANLCYAILQDHQGTIWISSNKGLSRLDPGTGAIRVYTEEDGLPSNEFNGTARTVLRDGRICFGSILGLVHFLPQSIRDNNHRPTVAITSLRIMNRPVELGPLMGSTQTPHLTQSWKDGFFTFTFSALDFQSPSKNRYAYRLLGLDKRWIETTAAERLATYARLNPGTYLFEVRGSNNDGLWNPRPATFAITITPPFHKTWWFVSGIALVLLTLLLGAHHLRTLHISQGVKHALLQEELRRKADFTAMLVHELRSPLTAIRGYAELLESHPDRLDARRVGFMTAQSSDRMITLVNNLLDLAKGEAGKLSIEPKATHLGALLVEHHGRFLPLAEHKNQHLELHLDMPPEECLVLADAFRLGQVLDNLLGNAIKFTPPEGTIRLGCHLLPDGRIEVSIGNTGTLIPEAKIPQLFDKYAQVSRQDAAVGTGLGLAVSRLIILMHQGEIGVRQEHQPDRNVFFFRLKPL